MISFYRYPFFQTEALPTMAQKALPLPISNFHSTTSNFHSNASNFHPTTSNFHSNASNFHSTLYFYSTLT